MFDIITLYNNGEALVIADRGDYVELLTHNQKPVNGCRWWYRGGVRYLGRLYKPVMIK